MVSPNSENFNAKSGVHSYGVNGFTLLQETVRSVELFRAMTCLF